MTALAERQVEYTPLGAGEPVRLTVKMVRDFLCTPTRSGKLPSDEQVVKFLMLCKSRELDPWVGDAYLVGYDSEDGPSFSLITAHQALLKRAELCQAFDGLESGVVVQTGSEVTYRPGDIVFNGENLIGGWARCHRKDRAVPTYDAVKLSTFNTSKSRWRKDPAGMIVKVAEASVLRGTFPSQNGGLYTADEMGSVTHANNSAAAIESVPMPVATQQSLPAADNGEVIDEAPFDNAQESDGGELPSIGQLTDAVNEAVANRGEAALTKLADEWLGPDQGWTTDDGEYKLAQGIIEEAKAKLMSKLARGEGSNKPKPPESPSEPTPSEKAEAAIKTAPDQATLERYMAAAKKKFGAKSDEFLYLLDLGNHRSEELAKSNGAAKAAAKT